MADKSIRKLRYRHILIRVTYLWIAIFALSLLAIITIYTGSWSLANERSSFEKEAGLFRLTSDYQTQFVISTIQIRSFLITGQPLYFANYLKAVNALKGMNNTMKYFQNMDVTESESKYLEATKSIVENILIIEIHALKLLASAYQVDPRLLPDEVNSFVLNADENQKSPEEKLQLAQTLLFDTNYQRYNIQVLEQLNAFQSTLESRFAYTAKINLKRTDLSFFILKALLVLQVLAILSIIWLRAITLRMYKSQH